MEEELKYLVGKVVVVSNNGCVWNDYLFEFVGGNYIVYNTDFSVDQVEMIEYGLKFPVIHLKQYK
jgi:hypothetical protein